MPAWGGKFQYLDTGGASLGEGPCQLTFDRESAIVTPAGGTPIAFDLGDVDQVAPGAWDLQLLLYTGHRLLLKQFGAAFSDMSREFLAAWRDRTVQCLLLEDLEELARYPGAANGAPAEIRIFKSNLAVLPQSGMPAQWRLAEVNAIRFDEASYGIVVERSGERLLLNKLGMKTDEAKAMLEAAIDGLRTQAAQALHNEFPFLSAPSLGRLQSVMPEGRSAALTELASIDARLPDALIARAVDEPLRPYFEALREKSAGGPLFAGFKFIRPEEGEDAAEGGEASPLFFWFFFPLPGNMLAWEATSGAGRATYFFRSCESPADSVSRLTRGLALINFRREPVYLPDASLEQQPRFHRYAIGARKLPELRALRSAFLGRAIHSSPEDWAQAAANVTGRGVV